MTSVFYFEYLLRPGRDFVTGRPSRFVKVDHAKSDEIADWSVSGLVAVLRIRGFLALLDDGSLDLPWRRYFHI